MEEKKLEHILLHYCIDGQTLIPVDQATKNQLKKKKMGILRMFSGHPSYFSSLRALINKTTDIILTNDGHALHLIQHVSMNIII